jgi:cytochrome P450
MHSVKDGTLFDAFHYGMLTANDAVHRRRRSPFSRTFAARTIASLRPQIRRCVEELIQGWYADGEAELVVQLASPLPARIISDLPGLPREDIPLLTVLVYETTRFFSLNLTPDEIPPIETAARQLKDYGKSAGRSSSREWNARLGFSVVMMLGLWRES